MPDLGSSKDIVYKETVDADNDGIFVDTKIAGSTVKVRVS